MKSYAKIWMNFEWFINLLKGKKRQRFVDMRLILTDLINSNTFQQQSYFECQRFTTIFLEHIAIENL